jgi:hypothetical protein
MVRHSVEHAAKLSIKRDCLAVHGRDEMRGLAKHRGLQKDASVSANYCASGS